MMQLTGVGALHQKGHGKGHCVGVYMDGYRRFTQGHGIFFVVCVVQVKVYQYTYITRHIQIYQYMYRYIWNVQGYQYTFIVNVSIDISALYAHMCKCISACEVYHNLQRRKFTTF